MNTMFICCTIPSGQQQQKYKPELPVPYAVN